MIKLDKIEEIKEEWEDMMESRQKIEAMMKDMPMEGMEEMKMEWDKMTQNMDKLQEMMGKMGV